MEQILTVVRSFVAFNLAEKYQIPVFILIDKYLSEGYKSFDNFKTEVKIERGKMLTQEELLKMKEYNRYKLTKDGVSARSLPGMQNGLHLTNSDEHDEYGFTIEGWTPEMRVAQVDKRAAKLPAILKDLPRPEIYGEKFAKIAILGWGSTRGPMLEAMQMLENIKYVHIPVVWPIDQKAIEKAISIDNVVFLDFHIEQEENVFPMVPAGEAINRMIGGMA